MSAPGDFGMNWKIPLLNFKIFILTPFATMQLYMFFLWNVRQLAKISLSGWQSPDPNTFLVSSLIKSL